MANSKRYSVILVSPSDHIKVIYDGPWTTSERIYIAMNQALDFLKSDAKVMINISSI